jgi:hypothetical protein
MIKKRQRCLASDLKGEANDRYYLATIGLVFFPQPRISPIPQYLKVKCSSEVRPGPDSGINAHIGKQSSSG